MSSKNVNSFSTINTVDTYSNSSLLGIVSGNLTRLTSGNLVLNKVNANNLVYNTGNQTISGAKTFERINIKAPDGQLVGYISGESLQDSYQKLIINGFGGPDEQNVLIQSAGNFITFGEANFAIANYNGALNFFGGEDIAIYGTRNLNADNITAAFKNAYASNLVYNTTDQTISGVKTFANNINVSGTGIFNAVDLNNIDVLSISGVNVSVINGNISLTNRPTVNGTGVLLSGEASSFTLPNTIVYTTGNQTINGNKIFNDNTYINNLFVTGTQTIINTTNFNVQSPYLLLNLTGGAVDGGIFFVTGANLTGLNDTGPIIGFDHSNKFKFGISTRNSDLSVLPDIASVQNITAYSGVADDKFATITNLATTGDRLNNKINTLSGNSVLTFGDQTINGVKTFTNRPTVNTTGVLLSGQNSFIIQASSSSTNLTNANTIYYFSIGGAGYSTNRTERHIPILDECLVKKITYSVQQNTTSTPGVNLTGYFINTTKNLTGIIFTGFNTTSDNNFYTFSKTDLNIPFSTGDNMVCGIATTTPSTTNIRSMVNIYCYN